MKTRIDSLDGLRALAALGVLWIHSWTIHGNPRLLVAGLDITNLLALGGNGVDLFFVISGFCMYYFYACKPSFTYEDFWIFIKKRWWRLSPAFYTSSVVYILVAYLINQDYPVIKSFLTSVFYLNSLSPYNAAGLFWSLGPEFQFYILIPFVLIYQSTIGFSQIFILILFVMGVTSILGVILLKNQSNILTNQITFRYFEFIWGIIVAKIILSKNHYLSYRILWMALFIFLAYAGRFLLSKPVLLVSENYSNLFKLAGFTIMSSGFGGIIYMTLTSKKWLQLILGNKLISMIGRISFSFYLWHGLVHIYIGNLIVRLLPDVQDIRLPIITFLMSTLILIPISQLSFRLLEKPFMFKGKK